MTRAPTRSNFHRSKLIRVLADLEVLQADEPATAFAEKLGLWIDFAAAIHLTGVHKESVANAPELHPELASMAGVSLDDEFARMRIGMESTIVNSSAASTARVRPELALPRLDTPLDDVRAYAPFRRYHQAHQRDMESNARSLRAKVRGSLAKASAPLQQLAALDAAFDGILGERESRLLSSIPSLLEKRFNHLRKAHQQTLLATSQADDKPDAWMKPGAWLARFCGELQAVLLAELDLRLQPAVGLLEAFNSQKSKHV